MDKVIFKMVDCENTILREIPYKEVKRKDIVQSYRLAMESDERDEVNWGKVNQAIVKRWSLNGLKYIKKLAWSGKCFENK